MEENNQSSNVAPPVSPVVQAPVTQPVSNVNPPAGGPKPKFPLAIIIGVILFLLIAGSAAGFYVFKPQIMRLVLKPTATPSPIVQKQIPTPTPDPTANWKTYESIKYNFTIKYPPDYKVVEDDKTNHDVEVYKIGADNVPGEGGIEFARLIIKSIDYASEDPKSMYYYAGFKNARQSNHFSSIRDSNSGDNIVKISFGKKTFYINCYLYNSPQDINTCNQILSTFKFTDSNVTPTPDPTANWKTYENSKLSIKYPPTWILNSAASNYQDVLFQSNDLQEDGFPHVIRGFTVGVAVNRGCLSSLTTTPPPLAGPMFNNDILKKTIQINGKAGFLLVGAGEGGMSYTIIPDGNQDACLYMAVPGDGGVKKLDFNNQTFLQNQSDFVAAASSLRVK